MIVHGEATTKKRIRSAYESDPLKRPRHSAYRHHSVPARRPLSPEPVSRLTIERLHALFQPTAPSLAIVRRGDDHPHLSLSAVLSPLPSTLAPAQPSSSAPLSTSRKDQDLTSSENRVEAASCSSSGMQLVHKGHRPDSGRGTTHQEQSTYIKRQSFGSTGDNAADDDRAHSSRASSGVENAKGLTDTHSSPPQLSHDQGSYVTPAEFVYEDVVDTDFGRRVQLAYEASCFEQSLRRHKYGPNVADVWKRGSTPEDAREHWERRQADDMADWYNVSDSDDG